MHLAAVKMLMPGLVKLSGSLQFRCEMKIDELIEPDRWTVWPISLLVPGVSCWYSLQIPHIGPFFRQITRAITVGNWKLITGHFDGPDSWQCHKSTALAYIKAISLCCAGVDEKACDILNLIPQSHFPVRHPLPLPQVSKTFQDPFTYFPIQISHLRSYAQLRILVIYQMINPLKISRIA